MSIAKCYYHYCIIYCSIFPMYSPCMLRSFCQVHRLIVLTVTWCSRPCEPAKLLLTRCSKNQQIMHGSQQSGDVNQQSYDGMALSTNIVISHHWMELGGGSMGNWYEFLYETCPRAGVITWPVDLQPSMLPLLSGCAIWLHHNRYKLCEVELWGRTVRWTLRWTMRCTWQKGQSKRIYLWWLLWLTSLLSPLTKCPFLNSYTLRVRRRKVQTFYWKQQQRVALHYTDTCRGRKVRRSKFKVTRVNNVNTDNG